MKNIVISDEYNEVDLRPSQLKERYISLTEQDVRSLLGAGKLKDCPCPACGAKEKKSAFSKFSLSYQECNNCRTLYVSPRPNDKTLNEYYLKSAARTFWRDELSRVTDKKRKEKIIKPRFQWVIESTREYFPTAKTWIDMNTSQASYIEAMADADIFEKKILLNPYLRVEPRDDQRITILSQPWWENPFKGQAPLSGGQADVVSLFEVADHTADVNGLFNSVAQILKPGGLCFMTAILASGFDVQMLWDKASNLYPPDRLNCFTVVGLKKLFARHGFECLEFSTPGILDVEIVATAIQENPGLNVPRFVRDLIENKDEEIQRQFQEFLQSSCMSSYGRVLLRKKR